MCHEHLSFLLHPHTADKAEYVFTEPGSIETFTIHNLISFLSISRTRWPIRAHTKTHKERRRINRLRTTLFNWNLIESFTCNKHIKLINFIQFHSAGLWHYMHVIRSSECPPTWQCHHRSSETTVRAHARIHTTNWRYFNYMRAFSILTK